MNKFFEILLVGLVFFVLAVNESAWAAKNFKDDDWTHSFFERCSSRGGFANGSQVEWMREGNTKFLRFTLADGQKGNCSRDKIRRSGAPYWERSEITLGTDDRNITRLRTGGFYQIKLRVRFVQGFASDKESILQIYTACPWKGRCSPLLQLRSHGYYPSPGTLYAEFLEQREEKHKKRSNWSSASKLDDYYQNRIPFRNDATEGLFRPMSYKGQWMNIDFGVSVSPKTITVVSQLESDSGLWTVPVKTIDRPPGVPDPHIEIGLYRAGSDTVPNPTSTIDFDYIKILKITEADYIKFKEKFHSDEVANPTHSGNFDKKNGASGSAYSSYSDKHICTMVEALNGLAEQKLWIKEAKLRGLSKCK